MSGNLVFFSVQADDLGRAMEFYGKVFGWKFEPWGPPGFFLISMENPDPSGICGSMQKRQDGVTGVRSGGFEPTFSVDDIDKAEKSIVAHGGKIIFPKCEIPTVGWIVKFEDTEGNIACAKQLPTKTN